MLTGEICRSSNRDFVSPVSKSLSPNAPWDLRLSHPNSMLQQRSEHRIFLLANWPVAFWDHDRIGRLYLIAFQALARYYDMTPRRCESLAELVRFGTRCRLHSSWATVQHNPLTKNYLRRTTVIAFCHISLAKLGPRCTAVCASGFLRSRTGADVVDRRKWWRRKYSDARHSG
jgi:hypothetical protein